MKTQHQEMLEKGEKEYNAMMFAQFQYLNAIEKIKAYATRTMPAETVRIMPDSFYAELKAAAR